MRNFIHPGVVPALAQLLALSGCADGGASALPGYTIDGELTSVNLVSFDATISGDVMTDRSLSAAPADELVRAQLPFVIAGFARKGVTMEVASEPVIVPPAADAFFPRSTWTVAVRGRADLGRLGAPSDEYLRHWSKSVWVPEDARDLRTRAGDACLDTSAPETAAEIDDAQYARRFDGWIWGCRTLQTLAVMVVDRIDRPDATGSIPSPVSDPEPDGWVRHDLSLESQHPYPEYTSSWRLIPLPREVSESGEPVRLRFERLDLAPDDSITLYETATTGLTYRGSATGLLTPPLAATELAIYLENQNRTVAWGYALVAYYTRAP